MAKTIIAGVGMTRFSKPSEGLGYLELGQEAAKAALDDANIAYSDVQQVFAGNAYAGSTSGQGVVYGLGMTGIPVVNVSNACATGSTALFLGRQLIETGALDCVLVLGFEQMVRGPLISPGLEALQQPTFRHRELAKKFSLGDAPNFAIDVFGAVVAEAEREFGIAGETLAEIVVKARRHGAKNERAIFRDTVTVDDVMNSPRISGKMTRLQACPPTSGGAAAVLVSEEFARKRGIDARVAIRSQAFCTDTVSLVDSDTSMTLIGDELIRKAAHDAYEAAGVGPQDIDVAELHDCFAINEAMVYAALGWAKIEDIPGFVKDGQNSYGGAVVTNPSGGLLSKGHPIGATGLGQTAELVWQLRGEAGSRQVEGARLALAENAGLGSAGFVTIYERLQ